MTNLETIASYALGLQPAITKIHEAGYLQEAAEPSVFNGESDTNEDFGNNNALLDFIGTALFGIAYKGLDDIIAGFFDGADKTLNEPEEPEEI